MNKEITPPINKINDPILNLTPENITQHSGIEWQLHTKEAQHPLIKTNKNDLKVQVLY